MNKLFIFIFITFLGYVGNAHSRTSEIDELTQSLYQEVRTILPDKFLNELQKFEIEVISEKLSDIPTDICNFDKKRRVIFGQFKNKKVIVNSELIKLYSQNGDYNISCPHKTLKRLIQATIIHELAHVFDDQGLYSNKDQYTSISFFEKTYYSDTEFTLNTEARFSIKNKNAKTSSSPDIYEYKDIRENFAVNVEYYFLDSSFGCRRPLKAQFFNKIFDMQVETDCENNYSIQLIDSANNKNINIHPSRVKKISYLLAGKGDNLESKFGHAQILLEVCENKKCGNLKKYVLGFMAATPDTYSMIGGLTGEYKSKIHVGDFLQTRLEYNVLELRDITEYPLKFSAIQKQRFLSLLLSSYWEYNGRYKFLSNNCATELFQLFKYAVNDESFYKKNVSTPISIVDELNSYNLIDKSKINIFHGDKVLSEKLKKMNIPLNPKTFISLDPTKRMEYFNRIKELADIYTFLLAESLSSQFWSKKIDSYILKNLDKSSELGLKIEKLKALLNTDSLSQSGYGIPVFDKDDNDQLDNQASKNGNDIKKELNEIREIVNQSKLDASNAAENIQANKDFLNKKLLESE